MITCTTECDLYFTCTILSLPSLLMELCCLKIFEVSDKVVTRILFPVPYSLSAMPCGIAIGQCCSPLLGSQSQSPMQSLQLCRAPLLNSVHFHNLIVLANLDAAQTCCSLIVLGIVHISYLKGPIAWIAIILSCSVGLRHSQVFMRETKKWYKSNALPNCTSLLQHTGSAELFKVKSRQNFECWALYFHCL